MCSVSELPGVRLRGLGARGPLRRCLCWCCCCSCASWAKCLAVRNGEDNGPTKKEAGPSDVLRCDGEPPPSLEEIQSWGKSFDKLMRSSAGRKVFRDFLRCEYSEENILFWLACEELKRESNADAVEEKARFIYEDYISILSPKEVSLDSRVREVVNRNMVEPTPHTFDEAQLQIYTLMHRDSYPRFVNSTLYKTLAQVAGGGAGGGGGGGNTGGGTTEEPAVSPSSPSATNTANNVVQEINPSTNETSQANSASTASLTTVSASGQALGALTTSGTKESAITTSGTNQCSLTTSTPANTQANNTLTSNTSVNSATLANSSNGVSPNAIPVNNTAGHKATNEEAQTNTRQENSAIEKKESAVEKKETVAENEESGKVIGDT